MKHFPQSVKFLVKVLESEWITFSVSVNVNETFFFNVSDVFKLKAKFAERQGERDEMQDKHVILYDFSKQVQQLDQSM